MINRLLKYLETVLLILIVSMAALRFGYLLGSWVRNGNP